MSEVIGQNLADWLETMGARETVKKKKKPLATSKFGRIASWNAQHVHP